MSGLQSVLRVFSLLLLLFSATLMLPLIISHATMDGAQHAYDEAMAMTVTVGALLWLATRRHDRELKIKDGFLLVVLVWLVLPVFASIPLQVFLPTLSFTDAYFESMSGLTATGATVLSGLDHLPLSINFWRTFLHWLGGMGVIVLAVAILPLLGVGGRQIFKAEAPGPMKESKLSPRMAETAKGFWVIYLILTTACALSLMLAGMEKWDALMHAFSIMGLGGFSTKDASLGHFGSLTVELVAMFFALLSGISYASHYMAFHGRSLRSYRHDPELPFYLGILGISIFCLTVYLMPTGIYEDFWHALRYVAFHTISLATSLGFATTDYAQWPMFASYGYFSSAASLPARDPPVAASKWCVPSSSTSRYSGK
jgi:trk system potassium uptake protein TrkH